MLTDTEKINHFACAVNFIAASQVHSREIEILKGFYQLQQPTAKEIEYCLSHRRENLFMRFLKLYFGYVSL